MPGMLWVAILASSTALVLLIVAVVVAARSSARERVNDSTAVEGGSDVLYESLPREARQFLVAAVQADTIVIVIGPRGAGVLDFLRALASPIRGRKPLVKLSRPAAMLSLVSRRPSCLAYLEAPGLVTGIAKMRSMVAEASPSLTPREVWQAIEASLDLWVIVRPVDQERVRVETIAEPAWHGPEDMLADHTLATVVFGWDEASQTLAATGVRPAVLSRLQRSGILLPDHLFAPRP
ncbi:MAG: hypothetical protein JXC32_21105 [Anaerolineae bacterium]|nr:hypothetical protein [Anaerolineae bacterium]